MRARPRVLPGLISLAILGAADGARADGPADLEAALSEPVVTTASKSAEDQSTAPATTTTISADDLRRYGIKTLAEAINFLSLGMMTQDNLDDVEIGARGVQLTGDNNDHVLLLINGHAVNEQWNGTAYFGRGAGVPFELIDHIEVILGPGSVLYGSQAMLGVINIVTKRAKDFDGFHIVGEGDLALPAHGQLGGAGRGAIAYGQEFTLFGTRGEMTWELEYYSQSGPGFTLGPENIGGKLCFNGVPGNCQNLGTWGGFPDSQGYWVKLPDGYLSVILGDFELDVHAESYQRAYPGQNYIGYNIDNQYELDRFLSGDLRHRWALSSTAQLRSRLYADAYSYRQQLPGVNPSQCYSGQDFGCIYELPGFSRWVGLEEQLSLDWLHDQSLTTLLGFDDRAIRVGEDSYATTGLTTLTGGSAPTGVFGPFDKAEYRVAGYAQQTWRPIKWLSLNGGVRADDELRVDDGVSHGHVSPRGVVAVEPWRGSTLKVIYSEAFRAPSYYETNYTDLQTVVTNVNLGPEIVRSGEVTAEQRVGAQRFFVGGFYATYEDLIISGVDSSVSAVQNGLLPAPTPDTDKKIISTYTSTVSQNQNSVNGVSDIGVNASFEGAAFDKNLRYGINFTYGYARRTEPNPLESRPCPGTSGPPQANCTLPLPVAPSAFGNARVSYDLPGDLPVLGFAAFAVDARPANHAFDTAWQTVPYAPAQLQLRWTVSGPFPGAPGLSYRLLANYVPGSDPVNPYFIGPATSPTKLQPAPVLVPVEQFRATVGLQYDFR